MTYDIQCNNREIEYIEHNYSSDASSLWAWSPDCSANEGAERGWPGAHGWSNKPGKDNVELVLLIPVGLPCLERGHQEKRRPVLTFLKVFSGSVWANSSTQYWVYGSKYPRNVILDKKTLSLDSRLWYSEPYFINCPCWKMCPRPPPFCSLIGGAVRGSCS